MWTEPNKFMYFTHLRPKPISLNVNKVIVSQFEVNDLAQKIFKGNILTFKRYILSQSIN